MPEATGELPSPKPHRFTVDDYLRMVDARVILPSDKVELLDGQVVDMSPQGLAHALALHRLQRLIDRRCGDRAEVIAQMPFAAAADSLPEPDIYVAELGTLVERWPNKAALVIEVADSSLGNDREIKGPIYAAAVVPEYWIVDVVNKVFEVYRDPRDGHYRSKQTFGMGQSVTATHVDGLTVELAAVLQ